jgi:predicted nucleic acid-binding protein
VALYYADSSALMKLLRVEEGSASLDTFIGEAKLVSCELVVTELSRAIIRVAHEDPTVVLDELLRHAAELLYTVGLRPLDRDLLIAAGDLPTPSLRTLDAIHVATALDLAPHDGFISYDERQSAAARLSGLRTFAPGA